jgi:hypothetical protein
MFAALALDAVSTAAAESNHVDTALIFVVDCSGSMDAKEVRFVRDAHREAILSPDVMQAVRETSTGQVAMAYVEFAAGMAWTAADWSLVRDQGSAEAFLGSAYRTGACGKDRVSGANTPIVQGFRQALLLANQIPYGYDRLVVDVIGDGKDNSGAYVDDSREYDPAEELGNARSALLTKGAVINGLPMILGTTEEDLVEWYCGDGAKGLEPHVRGGMGSFCRTLDHIEDLPLELRHKIVEELY